MQNHIARKYTVEQAMMTLNAIAYMPFDNIAGLQNNLDAAEALEQAYSAIWWVQDDAHLLYVVKDRERGDYVIVARGPVFRFGLSLLLDLYEDLDAAHQVSLPFSKFGAAKVATGLSKSVEHLTTLAYNGRTVNQLVNIFPGGTRVYITGHSLGGAIASLYAVRLACSNLLSLEVIPYTFGAPAIGNDAFARLFDAGKKNCVLPNSYRCVNNLDIIPYIWQNLQDLTSIRYGDLKCPFELNLLSDSVEQMLILSKVYYIQPPISAELSSDIEFRNEYFAEVAYQHQANTYLQLLGVEPIESPGFTYKRKNEHRLINSL